MDFGGEKKEVSPEEMATNPAVTIGGFVGSLLLYYVIRYFLVDSKAKYSKVVLIILSIVFIVIISGSQIGTYTLLSKRICNEPQVSQAVKVTFLTNILFVGLIAVLLKLFPGFKQPFTNTFGYLIVFVFGVKKAMNRLLLSSAEGGDIVKQIYEDPSLLINMITPENFNKVIEKLQKGSPPVIDPDPKDVVKLYKLVGLKDMIGELIWVVLGGSLAIATGYNMMMNISSCNRGEATQAKLAGSTALANAKDKVGG